MLKYFFLILLIISMSFAKGRLTIDKNGKTWAAVLTSSGEKIFRKENGNWKKITIPGLETNNINNLYHINGNLYVAASNGVYQYNELSWKKISELPAYSLNFEGERMWVCSSDKVTRDGKNYLTFSIEYTEIRSMVSHRGLKFFATNFGIMQTNKQLYFINKRNISSYKSKSVTDFEVSSGRLYALVDNKLKYFEGSWKDRGKRGSILFDYQGKLIIGNYGKLVIGNDSYTLKGEVCGLSKNKSGKLVVLTSQNRMYNFDGTKLNEIKLPI